MKKKIISSLVLIALMIMGVSSCFAAELPENTIATQSGYFQFDYEGEDLIEITKFYEKGASDVIIPTTINGKKVYAIGGGAFKDINSMYTVTIPSSVYIHEDAFDNCQNLKTVNFGMNSYNAPSKNIGHVFGGAFNNCKNLKELYIYENMSEFSEKTKEPNVFFTGSDNLKTIHGHKGSSVEKYAEKHGLTFKPLVPFNDVTVNDWYYKAAKFSYEKGMIKGYNSTTFAPNDKMTRGMLVTILWRLEGSPKATGKKKFPDVDYNAYYGNAIKWAYDSRVVLGYDNGKFGPDDEITREDFIVILARYEGQIYDNTDIFFGEEQDLAKFKDNKDVDRYALKRMQWAVRTGIITGNDDGTLNPRGTATRAEDAAILQKYNNKVVAKR